MFKTSILAFATCLLTSSVLLQNAAAAETEMLGDATPQRSFARDYFTKYAPRTALDMVARIPGFSISGSAGGKRGLGQGGANVLINGKRISGKTGPTDRLSRINAASVVRIDILDGASLNIPGLSGQVANIVYKSTTVNGNWKWTPWLRNHVQPNLLAGEVNVSGQTGALQWSLALRNPAGRFGNHGREFRHLADGTLIETRDEKTAFSYDTPTLATSLSWTPKANHVFNLNAEVSKTNFDISEISGHTAFGPRGDNHETRFDNGSDNFRAEIGGDYSFPFGPQSLDGTLKLIGVGRYLHSPSRARFTTFSSGARIAASRFSTDNKTSEAIARAEYSWAGKKDQSWQLSLEGAYNRLNADGGLQVLDTSAGQFINIPLTGSTAIVTEKRGEATLAHTRKISSGFDVQVSLGAEYSQLRQTTGSLIVTRDFFRPKGFISASYKTGQLTIRPKLARKVGQLDFNDFISSVSLRDDLSNAGNADLVPAQTWAMEVEIEKKFGHGTIMTIRPYIDFISDLVDRIPVGTNGDAVGNIPSAKDYGIDIDTTIKGEMFGLEGLQIDTYLDLRNSSVDDPLTGRARRLNGDKITFWEISLRHDIKNTNWAYGSKIENISKSLVYRLDTISTPGGGDLQTKPKLSAFIEYKDIFGLKLKAEIINLLDAKDSSDRTLFTDRRDLGQPDITESSRKNFGQTLRLSLSGTF